MGPANYARPAYLSPELEVRLRELLAAHGERWVARHCGVTTHCVTKIVDGGGVTERVRDKIEHALAALRVWQERKGRTG